MKPFLLPFFLFFCCQFGASQNWQLLGEDEIGDWQVTGAHDFSSAFYASDTDQDSLWFMFVFDISNWDLSGDFGLALGADTNLVTNDGIAWGGLNQSMKTDIQYIFTRNFVFQTNIMNNATNPIQANIYESGTHDTLIFRFPLAEFDGDGRFNVIAGVATFFLGVGGTVYEEIPSDGFFSIDLTSPVFEIGGKKFSIKVFPNPASRAIWVESKGQEIEKLLLLDWTGKTIVASVGNYLALPKLPNGTYLLGIEAGGVQNRIFQKIVILNHE